MLWAIDLDLMYIRLNISYMTMDDPGRHNIILPQKMCTSDVIYVSLISA